MSQARTERDIFVGLALDVCPLWVISGHFGMESGYPASIGRCAIEVEVADHIVAVAPVELLISFK